ncbi:MAG: hypothetical protein HRT57_11150 [Crocinitomicaceae bacterium]|nr:hypothetical protein [Crocinitomicaceae bacterium]
MLKLVLSKSLIFVGIVGSMLIFNSCSETKPDEKGPDEFDLNEDYYEFQAFDMAGHGVNAYIFLPDETANIGASTKPDVEHMEDDIYWEINVGPNFSMTIEDWAANKDLVKTEKKELAAKKFFKVKYLVDDKDLIVYERILLVKGTDKASPSVGVEHRTYHVYGQVTIDGVTYALESREEGFEKKIIELMAKSIRSFKPKMAS